jgi:N6-adenosine-specific RNA methylase IME4
VNAALWSSGASLFGESLSPAAVARRQAPLFAPLPAVAGGFACVVADVPSRFRSNSEARPGRNAMRHHTCHSMATIATLPVQDVVARDAFLWFWTTGPLISIGAHIPVMRAWGFEPTRWLSSG